MMLGEFLLLFSLNKLSIINLKQFIMSVLLNECKEITSTQYCQLPGTPEFMGQTKLSDDNMFWMTFKSEGIMYKIHCKL